MSYQATVQLDWPPEGGRAQLPAGPNYSTVAVFSDDLADGGTWSIVATFLLDDPSKSTARVRFLSPDAPPALLSPGVRFRLVEGARTVACARVIELSVSDDVP